VQQSLNIQLIDAEEPKDKKSLQILEATLTLFIENGVRKTSIDDIAEKAGIGRATVYRKFKDKDELVQAVIIREINSKLSELEKYVKDIVSPLDALIEAFVQAVYLAHSNPLIRRLIESEPDYTLPFLTTKYGPTMALSRHYLGEQIRRAQKMGQISDLPADTSAELLLRLIQSLLLSPAGIIDPSDRDNLRRFAMNYLRTLFVPA
jgi:TetR/AcrR family transcriptional repressor of uid operon